MEKYDNKFDKLFEHFDKERDITIRVGQAGKDLLDKMLEEEADKYISQYKSFKEAEKRIFSEKFHPLLDDAPFLRTMEYLNKLQNNEEIHQRRD